MWDDELGEYYPNDNNPTPDLRELDIPGVGARNEFFKGIEWLRL